MASAQHRPAAIRTPLNVILSAAATSRSEVSAQSKDPYMLFGSAIALREFSFCSRLFGLLNFEVLMHVYHHPPTPLLLESGG